MHNPNKQLLKLKIKFVKDLLPKLNIEESKLIYEKNIINSIRHHLLQNNYEHNIDFQEIENNCCEKIINKN